MSRQPEVGEIPEHAAKDLKQVEKDLDEAEAEIRTCAMLTVQ